MREEDMFIRQAPVSAPTFYDVRGVAEMFKMSRMTVYRAIRSGELPAVRIRGRWLVPAKVIDALVAQAEAAVSERPVVAVSEWTSQEPARRDFTSEINRPGRLAAERDLGR